MKNITKALKVNYINLYFKISNFFKSAKSNVATKVFAVFSKKKKKNKKKSLKIKKEIFLSFLYALIFYFLSNILFFSRKTLVSISSLFI